MGLNERQVRAVLYVVENGSITNTQYVEIFDVSRQTATIDLVELTDTFNILKRKGLGGAGTSYYLFDS